MNELERQKTIASALIRDAIRSFNFSNYGFDEVEEAKAEEWLSDLAEHIVERVCL